jgi:type VI secretion system secreted protein Hcp
MAYDAFLRLDGITGESQKEHHKDQIDITSFSWGANNSSSVGTGTGVSVGKVSVNDFAIVKTTDLSSPTLFQKCCDGSVIPTGNVYLRRQIQGNATVYLQYTFQNVYVTNISWAGTGGGGDDAPVETVAFCFEVGTVDYSPQLDDGSLGNAVHGGWNVGRNAAA